MAKSRSVLWATIPSGGTTSGEVPVGHRRVVGIQMPAAWTTATIAFTALTRQTAGAVPTKTFGNVVDADGTTALSITTPTADTYISLTPGLKQALDAPGTIKLVAGASQGADRVIGVVCVED